MLIRPKMFRWAAIFLIVASILSAISFLPIAHAGGGEKGGAELWANNCKQCHNLRTPSTFSSDQWEMLVTHMRFRCGLTANETKKIRDFLKTAN